jgi:hypothetical protein
MKNKFDIKKLKYLKGAIESGMSDDKIVEWLDKSKYSTEDYLEIIKLLLKDLSKFIE